MSTKYAKRSQEGIKSNLVTLKLKNPKLRTLRILSLVGDSRKLLVLIH